MDLLGELMDLLREVRVRLEQLAERDEHLLVLQGLDVMVTRQGLVASGGPVLAHHDDRGLRSEEHTSELQSRENLVCRRLLEKKNQRRTRPARRQTTRNSWRSRGRKR